MNRRTFVKNSGLVTASGLFGLPGVSFIPTPHKMIEVVKTNADFEREKLIRPFGFKGGYLTELWQTVVQLTSASGKSGIGIATQSVLYGDADLFAAHSESGGNALMYAVADKALQLVKKTPFSDPVELLEKILPALHEDSKKITGKENLNPNFIYNALVSVDNAAWLLYAAENNISSFDRMIPARFRKALQHHNEKIAVMYQVPYAMPMEEVIKAVKDGYFVIKIKAGFPGNQDQMLKGDMERLTVIHNALKDLRTPQTKNGKLIYTIDANGRYEKKDTLMRYLDHAKKIGALEQILLFEEPFIESNEESVNDTGIIIAADESVHTEADALKRIQQGYGSLVLKGIAKTLSMSMRIAHLAAKNNIPCFCADLTVNPVLIDWHKNLAARLMPFPGLNMGMMETNGDMNYRNWKQLVNYHPAAGADWTKVKDGAFHLGKNFYERSGGIFEPMPHYQDLFKQGS